MPRTRQTPQLTKAQQSIIQAFDNMQSVQQAKRGRPRKVTKAKKLELDDATIIPVANGYVVKSTSTGKELFVFEDLEKVNEFIRAKLKPTAEQSAFLDKV